MFESFIVPGIKKKLYAFAAELNCPVTEVSAIIAVENNRADFKILICRNTIPVREIKLSELL